MLTPSLSAVDPQQTFSALFGHLVGEHQQVPSAELTTHVQLPSAYDPRGVAVSSHPTDIPASNTSRYLLPKRNHLSCKFMRLRGAS